MTAHLEHYLRKELYGLVQSDPAIFDFLEKGSLDGVWYWDLTDTDHEWMSDRFWETFGYDPATKAPLASSWQDMIDPGDLQRAFEMVQAHLADPDHAYDMVVRYRHAQGHTAWVRCRGIAIRDANGVPIRMLGAHQDITELKQVEARLTHAVDQLAHVNEELRRFAYAASHDIRSPAKTLTSMLSRLAERHADSLDDEGRQLLAFAEQSALRIGEMSTRVLDYSTVTQSDLAATHVAVEGVVDAVVMDLTSCVEASGATVDVDVAAGLTVWGDATMLRVALQNLVENALKYRGTASPRVRITGELAKMGNTCVIRVDDNGIGVPPERREEIFGAFQRLHRRSEYSGVGLGLSMVKQVVQVLCGSISVHDSPLGGARFELRLPTVAQEGV